MNFWDNYVIIENQLKILKKFIRYLPIFIILRHIEIVNKNYTFHS